MSTPYDQGIDDLMALYRKQREEAAETRRRINEVTGTGVAPRQSVKISVSANGDITAIDFPTGAYRRMPPKELSEALMTAFAQAREKALEQVAELTSLGLPPGVGVGDLLQGKADPTVLLSEDPTMPDSVRHYIDHGSADGLRGDR